MKELWVIYAFHVKELVRKKGFLISSLIIAAIIILSSFISYQLSQNDSSKEEVSIAYQLEGLVLSEKGLNDIFKESDYHITFVDKTADELKKAVKEKEIDSAFALEGSIEKPRLIHYYRNYPSQELAVFIEKTLENQAISNALIDAGVDANLLSNIDVLFTMENKELTNTEANYGLIYPFVFLMYVFIMGFGQSIAMSVVSEKSTKVIEILLPKIKAVHSFYAKIFAALTMGLIQLVVTVLSFGFVRVMGWVDGGQIKLLWMSINLSELSLSMMVTFVLFFLGGFILYGLLYASLGAKVSRVEDLGPVLTPIVFLIMGAFFLGIFTLLNPESIISTGASYIPFFTPIVLFARILLDVASLPEIIVSVSIFVFTLIILTKLCEKWFVQGISHYGSTKKKKK